MIRLLLIAASAITLIAFLGSSRDLDSRRMESHRTRNESPQRTKLPHSHLEVGKKAEEERTLVVPTSLANLEAERGLVLVRGTVTKEGLPIEGYSLAFRLLGVSDPLEGESVDSEHGGAFEIRLPPGLYDVCAEDQGSRLLSLEVSTNRDHLELLVELPVGAIQGSVGRVTSSRRIRDACVQLLGPLGMNPSPSTRRTNFEGKFRFDDLLPGLYELWAEWNDHVSKRVRVEVHDTPIERLRLDVNEGLTLSGVLWGPNSSLESARLIACAWDGDSRLSNAHLALGKGTATDNAGSFEISGLAPGRYWLLASHSRRGDDLGVSTFVDVRAGMIPLRLIASSCANLEVTIGDQEGKALQDATLELRPVHTPGIGSFDQFRNSPQTDVSGRITLDDVLPGDYDVTASWWGLRSETVRIHVRAESLNRVSLRITSSISHSRTPRDRRPNR